MIDLFPDGFEERDALDGDVEFVAGAAVASTVMAAPPGTTHGIHPPTGRARLLNFHVPDSGFAGRVRAG